MAITVSQIDRTTYGVKINISGIVNDRQIYVWDGEIGEWVKLSDAVGGIVTSFQRETSNNPNEWVWIYFNTNYVDNLGYKVWDIEVDNVLNGNWTDVCYISTVVKFDWTTNQVKSTDETVDIYAYDFNSLDFFSHYILKWIDGTTNGFVNNDYWVTGDYIYASDLRALAQKIYDTAGNLTSTELPNRTSIRTDLAVILDYANADGYLYGYYFNYIRNAINNFNLTKTS